MKPEQINKFLRNNGRMQPWFFKNTNDLYENSVKNYYEKTASVMPFQLERRAAAMENRAPVRTLMNMESERNERRLAAPFLHTKVLAQPLTQALSPSQRCGVCAQASPLIRSVMEANRRRSVSINVIRHGVNGANYDTYGGRDITSSDRSSCASNGCHISTPRVASHPRPNAAADPLPLSHALRDCHYSRSLSMPTHMRPKRMHDYTESPSPPSPPPPRPPNRNGQSSFDSPCSAGGDKLMIVDAALKERLAVKLSGKNKSAPPNALRFRHDNLDGRYFAQLPHEYVLRSEKARMQKEVREENRRLRSLGDRIKQFESIQFADGPVSAQVFKKRLRPSSVKIGPLRMPCPMATKSSSSSRCKHTSSRSSTSSSSIISRSSDTSGSSASSDGFDASAGNDVANSRRRLDMPASLLKRRMPPQLVVRDAHAAHAPQDAYEAMANIPQPHIMTKDEACARAQGKNGNADDAADETQANEYNSHWPQSTVEQFECGGCIGRNPTWPPKPLPICWTRLPQQASVQQWPNVCTNPPPPPPAPPIHRDGEKAASKLLEDSRLPAALGQQRPDTTVRRSANASAVVASGSDAAGDAVMTAGGRQPIDRWSRCRADSSDHNPDAISVPITATTTKRRSESKLNDYYTMSSSTGPGPTSDCKPLPDTVATFASNNDVAAITTTTTTTTGREKRLPASAFDSNCSIHVAAAADQEHLHTIGGRPKRPNLPLTPQRQPTPRWSQKLTDTVTGTGTGIQGPEREPRTDDPAPQACVHLLRDAEQLTSQLPQFRDGVRSHAIETSAKKVSTWLQHRSAAGLAEPTPASASAKLSAEKRSVPKSSKIVQSKYARDRCRRSNQQQQQQHQDQQLQLKSRSPQLLADQQQAPRRQQSKQKKQQQQQPQQQHQQQQQQHACRNSLKQQTTAKVKERATVKSASAAATTKKTAKRATPTPAPLPSPPAAAAAAAATATATATATAKIPTPTTTTARQQQMLPGLGTKTKTTKEKPCSKPLRTTMGGFQHQHQHQQCPNHNQRKQQQQPQPQRQQQQHFHYCHHKEQQQQQKEQQQQQKEQQHRQRQRQRQQEQQEEEQLTILPVYTRLPQKRKSPPALKSSLDDEMNADTTCAGGVLAGSAGGGIGHAWPQLHGQCRHHQHQRSPQQQQQQQQQQKDFYQHDVPHTNERKTSLLF